MTKTAALELATASVVPVIGDDGEPLRRIKLLPYGDPFHGRDGRGPYRMRDAGEGEAVIAATQRFQGDIDLFADYDHQAVFAAKDGVGGTARAAGWIKLDSLQAEPDGIYADVDWTEAAAASLRAREYRYISPFFMHERGTGRITRIANIGLTNTPNLDLPAVASAQPEGVQMDLTKIAEALGLSADAGVDTIATAVTKLKTDGAAASQALATTVSALGLAPGATKEEIATAASVLKSQPGAVDVSQFVPRAAFDKLREQVEAGREEKAVASVDHAIEAGKVTPAQREWALDQARNHDAAWASFLAVAPAFKGGKLLDTDPADGEVRLTAEEQAVCSSMGWDQAEYLDQKKKEQA